jgi:hypothetical protein
MTSITRIVRLPYGDSNEVIERLLQTTNLAVITDYRYVGDDPIQQSDLYAVTGRLTERNWSKGVLIARRIQRIIQ